MHIMEGFLPFTWAVFLVGGSHSFLDHRLHAGPVVLVAEQPEQRLLLGLAGGFVFVLSALKNPQRYRFQ